MRPLGPALSPLRFARRGARLLAPACVLVLLAPGGRAFSQGQPAGDAPLVQSVDILQNQFLPAGDASLLRLDQGRGPVRHAAAQGGLPAAVGHGVSRRPAPRRARRPQGQDRDLRRPGASPCPDRRLPRSQEHHDHEHRGQAQGEGRQDQDRHLLRPGEGPAGGGDHPGDAGGGGSSLGHGAPRDEGSRRVGDPAQLRDRRGSEGEGEDHHVLGEHGLLRRQAPRPHEEDQAGGVLEPELARREDDLHRREMGRGPEEPSRLLSRPRLRHRGGRRAQGHLYRREIGALQEEAREVDQPRHTRDRGGAVPDRLGDLRGPEAVQGALRATVLQAQHRGRLQGEPVQEGIRQAPGRVRSLRLFPVDGLHRSGRPTTRRRSSTS